MAKILPDTPPQGSPAEVLRTFKSLKNLPNSYYVWHHLAPWQPDTPDFLIVTKDRRGLLVKVSSSSREQTSTAAQLLLIEDDRTPLGTIESIMFKNFLSQVTLNEEVSLETLVVFASIPTKQVLESRLERQPGEPQWVGRELIQPDSCLMWEAYFPEKPLDLTSLEKLRQQFTPEVVVPQTMTVRPVTEHRIEAGLTHFLLDYNQETALKMDLGLGDDGQSLSSDFRLNIINGAAGSGKTLILLYRLRLLYHFYPNKKFLVLTHNKPLSHDLQSRYYRLDGKLPENIEWGTFNGWCRKHWPKQSDWIQPVSMDKRYNLIHQVWKHNLHDTSITERMLLGEIDWIKDQFPMTQTDYLTVDRRGRGFGLTVDQRQRLWQAFQTYQNKLSVDNMIDWGDVPQKLWDFSEEGLISIPQYDFILIDEAQFFAPLWVALVQKALKPHNAHLFIVADPTQGFLRRKATWKSLGLDARGKTHALKRCYRTTKEIMQFATLFYRQRLPDEQEEDVLFPDMTHMPSGVIPHILPLACAQDEIARVANEVEDFVNQGHPKQHLLILHANGNGVNNLVQAINQRLGKNAAMDPKETYPGDYVRVTTLNAGAGLESPIVFLVGLRNLFEEEQSLRLSDDERVELIRDHTRKIYMAATRAGQRLVVTYVGEFPEVLRGHFINGLG